VAASLADKAVGGAAWTIATGVGSRALGLVGTLLLTRFVAPDDYGEVMAASVYTLLVNQFATVGLGQYVIAKPGAGRDVAFHATFFHLVIGVFALAGAWVMRDVLGPVFGAPRMGMYVPGLILAVMLDRVSFMPERVLVRDMRFRAVGISRTASEVAYSGVSVALAVAGFGANAVVLGNVARSLLRCLMLVAAADRRDWLTPSPITGATSRALFAFGLPLWIGAFSGFASRRVDNLLVTAFFGDAMGGMYSLAYNLADIPAVQVGEQIGDVLLPSFAKMEPERRASALVRSTALLALIMSPLAVGLGVIAPTATRLFFNQKWAALGPMLMYLSALSITRPLGWTVSSYLQARDRPRHVMWLETFKVVALVGMICAMGRNGPLWTCVAVGVAFGAHALASLWVVQLLDAVPFGAMLLRLAPPLGACAPLVGAVLGARWLLAHAGVHAAWIALPVEITAGAVAYVAAALLVARRTSMDLIKLLKNALASRSTAASARR
jgi:lipopolysaccharide exporter